MPIHFISLEKKNTYSILGQQGRNISQKRYGNTGYMDMEIQEIQVVFFSETLLPEKYLDS